MDNLQRDPVEVIFSVFLNWVVGVFPALLLRYVVFRKPISKKLSLVCSVLVGFFLFILTVWLGHVLEVKPNMAPVVIWTFITHWILQKQGKPSYRPRKLEGPVLFDQGQQSGVGSKTRPEADREKL